MERSRTRRFKAPLLPIAAAVVATLAAWEITARLLLADPIDPNLAGMLDRESDVPRMEPGSHWTTREGVEININELGFRSQRAGERIPAKSSGRVRVAVLGDSETFCRTLSYQECYPGQLGRALRQKVPGIAFEVYAFAIPGADSSMQLRMLREYVLPIEPDLVILNYCMNDIESFDASTIDLSHWYDRSFVVRDLRFQRFRATTDELRAKKVEQYRQWNEGRRDDTIWADYYASLYSSPLWDATRKTILEIKSEAEAAGAEFVMATTTEITAVEDFTFERYRHRKSLAVVRTIAEDGVTLIDTLPAFARAGRPGRHYYVAPGNTHKTAEGNRLLAEHLVDHPEFQSVLGRLVGGRGDAAGAGGSERGRVAPDR